MARVVAVRVPEELYEELKRRAERKGYTLVSDYLLDIIARELGYKEREMPSTGDVEALVERIVEEKLRQELGRLAEKGEVRVEPASVEEIAARIRASLERKLQDMINPWTAKIDTLSARLAEVVERLEALEQKIGTLEEKLRELEEAAGEQPRHAEARRTQASYTRPHGAHGTVQQERTTRRRRTAIERLKEQGVVFEREVQWLRDRDAFFERLRREGAIVLDLGGERVAVDPEFWRSFREKLEALPTANEDEIKILLTNQQYELFRKLKEQGLIYFDTTSKSWKLVENLGE